MNIEQSTFVDTFLKLSDLFLWEVGLDTVTFSNRECTSSDIYCWHTQVLLCFAIFNSIDTFPYNCCNISVVIPKKIFAQDKEKF